MNRWKLKMLQRLYRDDNLDADSGGGGSAPAEVVDTGAADKEMMGRALDAMDAEFGPDEDDEGAKDDEPVEKPAPTAPAAPATPVEPVEGGPNTYKSLTGKIVDTTKAPAGWTPEDAVGFDALAEPVRKAIHAREDQFHKGLETFRGEAAFAAPLRAALAPHMDTITAGGATPEQAVSYLFEINHRISTGTTAQKVDTFKHLIQVSGLKLEDFGIGSDPDDQAPYVDPEVVRLREETEQIKLQLQAQERNEKLALRQRSEQELDSFLAATPGAETLMNEMLPFLRSGLTLQQAHEKAVWLNPVTRQAKIDADAKAKADLATKAAAEKVEAARKASSVNVKSSARQGSPTAPAGSIDDTMREVYRKMNQ